jgi:hypothetical protein
MAWTMSGLLAVWCVVALYIGVRPDWLRWLVLILFLGAWISAALKLRGGWRMGGVLALMAAVLGWWFGQRPSNNRTWRPDVAVLPWAEFAGDEVTIHNVRNCDYRTEADFDVRHDDRTFDLRQLQSVDLLLITWGTPLIAHTMVSFGFTDGRQLCISIETRMEQGESYSAIKGFFRQFELTYVIADERDVVRLRTNYRQGEEVFLYRIRMEPTRLRALLTDYLARANALRERAEWYNALTSNCTTNIRLHSNAATGRRTPFDWRILLNGGLDQMLFERGVLASTLPFAELKPRSHINDAAQSADAEPDFSRRIRADLPGMTTP